MNIGNSIRIHSSILSKHHYLQQRLNDDIIWNEFEEILINSPCHSSPFPLVIVILSPIFFLKTLVKCLLSSFEKENSENLALISLSDTSQSRLKY
jgi:hypothetical protein